MRANQIHLPMYLFTINFLNQLKDDYIFPDGTTVDVELVPRIIYEYYVRRIRRTPVTFPVKRLVLVLIKTEFTWWEVC